MLLTECWVFLGSEQHVWKSHEVPFLGNINPQNKIAYLIIYAIFNVDRIYNLFLDQKWKASIIETHTSFAATAFTWAHEIGHAINMHHDFKMFYPFTPRNDVHGRECSKVSGIMDYSYEFPRIWSPCSREDLTKFYINEMSRFGSFCLA